MPYTPPSHNSPSVSKSSSPTLSRSHSYANSQLLNPESAATGRPQLPRSSASSSYLSKHRRSPSLNEVRHEVLHNGESYEENSISDPYGSLRQSPPPASNSLIPTGMTISPPDSSHNSSDEEDNRGRGRKLEDENLKQLHAAIRSIEQSKSGSPNRDPKPEANGIQSNDFATQDTSSNKLSIRPPLSQEARKISHSRSSTDSNIVFDPTVQVDSSPAQYKNDSEEEEESDESLSNRPPMLRKKSGELVRPALRASSRRRPSSMPGTPTFSKAVHFDSHLEHVRHFLQVDKPLAVSAGSSPVENYESESEFPFGSDDSRSRSREPSYEWEIRLANFAHNELEARQSWPVHVERIFLSSDNKTLVGSIAVQNLAFHKSVTARFTFDYWKTTSEVVADYNHDVRRKIQNDGQDHFSFSIKLADQVNLGNKTLFFCVRYNVNGEEHWDSNCGMNYQVDFTKKAKVQHGKNGMPGLGARPLNALPRSTSPRSVSSQRPRSYPVSFDDFATGFDSLNLGDHTGDLMGEPKIKLRNPRTRAELVPDAPTRRPKSSGQAFGNRYDFNSSLSAAKGTAFAILGEQSGLSSIPNAKQSSTQVPAATVPANSSLVANGTKSESLSGSGKTETVSKAPAVGPVTAKPAALLSEKPPLTSQSYQELVEKYCFFGTPKSTPPLTRTALSMMDGAADYIMSNISTSSGLSSSHSGSSTPLATRAVSPSPPSELSSVRHFSPQNSRSTSPLPGSCYGSRSASTMAFAYPYPLSNQQLAFESPASTVIHG